MMESRMESFQDLLEENEEPTQINEEHSAEHTVTVPRWLLQSVI